jgi:ABC-type Fe3+-hydroxamate transport system substrate-binding protein
MTEMRIISLVPSVTETLSAWNHTPIACTRFCERADLPHVGGTKNPDVDRIVELAPDLVVIDAEENRREDHDAMVERGIAVHVLDVCSLDDVNPSMFALAEVVGAQWKPVEYPTPIPERTRAFIPIWRRPWMALGQPTYGSSLLAHLGVINVFDDQGPYPTVELDDVIQRHPNVVLAPNEPYPFAERHLGELEKVAPTLLIDGKDLFWWGVRTSGARSRLAVVLQEL